MNIGKSVVIKGELSGSEDLTIEGQVEGKIELRQNLLTIGPNARIKAQVFAKTVVVEGQVHGNISAGERIDIRDKGTVEGNLAAPRVAIADGAHFRGSIDMQGSGKIAEAAPEAKPAAVAAPSIPTGPAPSVVALSRGDDRGGHDTPVSRFFSWGARTGETPVEPTPTSSRIAETLSSSRALPKLIAALSSQPSPILLDLGPVVGTNVSFLGERLSCKMLIEDLREDVEGAMARGSVEGLGDALVARVTSAVPERVHGVLCWDLFDSLDRHAARALAGCLSGLLRPKGLLHGFFGTVSGELDSRTKFIVQSDTTVKCRREPAPRVRRFAHQTGEISRLFEGLSTVESVLLQNHTREVLLRKN